MTDFKTIDAFIKAIADNECEEATFKGKTSFFGKSHLTIKQQQDLAAAINQNTRLKALDISDIGIYTTVMDAIGNALGANRMPLKSLRLHNCNLIISEAFCIGFRQNTSMRSLELTQPIQFIGWINGIIEALDSREPTDLAVNTTLEVLNIKDTTPANFNTAVRYAYILGSSVSLKEISTASRGYELEHILCVKNICRKLPGMYSTKVTHSMFSTLINPRALEEVTAYIEKQNFEVAGSYIPRDKGQLHFITPGTCEEVEGLLQDVANQDLKGLALTIEHVSDNHLIIKASDAKLTTLFKGLEQGIEQLQTGRQIKSARKGIEYTSLFSPAAPLHSSDDDEIQNTTSPTPKGF